MRVLLSRQLVWLSLGIASFLLLLPLPASALEVTPAELNFTAPAGGQTTATMNLVNDEEQPQSYRIYADEEYRDWFTISPEEVLLSPHQSGEVAITVSPPPNTTGEHTAFLYITSAGPSGGLQVALGIKVRANITVNTTVNTTGYGWGIFRDNLPLTVGVIGGVVSLIVGVVLWRRRRARYYY